MTIEIPCVARGQGRAHDVTIGLAVAWARQRQPTAWCSGAIALAHDFSVTLVITRERSAWIDRGRAVCPTPLVDARVAFGIGLAQVNRRRGWCQFVPMQQFMGILDCVQHSDGEFVRVGGIVIDLRCSMWIRSGR